MRMGGLVANIIRAASRVSFTPVPGPRLLVRPGPRAEEARSALIKGLTRLCQQRQASSVHVTFALGGECDLLAERGFLPRMDQQFHWQNAGFSCFEEFLRALAARKRKAYPAGAPRCFWRPASTLFA